METNGDVGNGGFPGAARAAAAEGAGAAAANRTRADAVVRRAARCLQTDAGDGELR